MIDYDCKQVKMNLWVKQGATQCYQAFLVFKSCSFQAILRTKTPILSKFYAQGPPGFKSLRGPPEQNSGSAPASIQIKCRKYCAVQHKSFTDEKPTQSADAAKHSLCTAVMLCSCVLHFCPKHVSDISTAARVLAS